MASNGDPQGHPPTVFVVDGDEGGRLWLSRVGKSAAPNTSASASFAELLAKYNLEQPGCRVVDPSLPRVSGLELQDYLNQRGGAIPMLLVNRSRGVSLAFEP